MFAYILLGGTIAAQVVSIKLTDRASGDVPTPEWWPLRADRVMSEKCGWYKDCHRRYSIQDVANAAAGQLGNVTVQTNLASIHEQARAACTSEWAINNHGGWCYADRGCKTDNTGTGGCVQAGPNSDIDYVLADGHVASDEGWVDVIATQVLPKKDGSCCSSITDLGAGVGQLGHALRAKLPTLQYYGYDGAGNVEEFTHSYVRFIDLTQPLDLPRTDWVISSEVGEHIPRRFEAQVIANLHAHNCKGLILSWAVLQQHGKGHVNCHSNGYLINTFEELGYTFNKKLTKSLRKAVGKSYWLKQSAMVFERNSTPAGCS